MYSLFVNCRKLEKIYVSNLWNVDNVSNSYNMFGGCNNIVGNNGTTYDNYKIDKTMAVVDTASTPGYLSKLLPKCSNVTIMQGGPGAGSNIYYSKYIIYDSSTHTYALLNPQQFTVGTDTTTLLGMYSSFGSLTTFINNVFYINALSSDGSISEYIPMNNGCIYR